MIFHEFSMKKGGEEEAGCANSFRGAAAVRPALPRCRPSYVADSARAHSYFLKKNNYFLSKQIQRSGS